MIIMNNKNSFAYQFFMSVFLLISFIKKNISNVCLGASALLILYYLFVVYGFNIMILGVAIMLLLVSLTTSISDKKEEKDNNKQRYY